MSDGVEAAARVKQHFHGNMDIDPRISAAELEEASQMIDAYLAAEATPIRWCETHDFPDTSREGTMTACWKWMGPGQICVWVERLIVEKST